MSEKPGAISSRRVYTGRVISLDVDTVHFPNDTVGELEMIRHPGASAVVPFLDDTAAENPRIVLIRQYRYAAGDYVFEIPAGRLDKGEAPATCAHRELREETGYSADRMVPMTTFYTTPGFTDEVIHLFAASGLIAGSSSLEPDEVLELQVMPLSAALSMVAKGEIKDGKTMIGLMFAAAFIRPG